MTACSSISTSQYEDNQFYVVVEATIHNVEKYDKFIKLEIPILTKYDAYMAMDIRSKDQKKRYLVISFPNRQANVDFVKSKAFQKIIALNKESASSKIFYGKLHKTDTVPNSYTQI